MNYRHYNPMALKLLKPTQSINKLIGQTHKTFGTNFYGSTTGRPFSNLSGTNVEFTMPDDPFTSMHEGGGN